ncbi:MAG TPA: FecR family protein [Methylomirabilota bacterium]|nr:FecR family protein [Methylomirabilota bacterium]
MTARARTDSLIMTGPMALLAAAAVVLTALVPALAHAQSSQGVGVVTSLTGQALVARASVPTALRLNFKDDVFERDRISTAEKSVVRILLGGKAVITVRELSQLTITEEVGRATVNLSSGKIAMSVLRSRMKPGEAIEVRTPNAVAAVRGTVLMAESIQGVDGGDNVSNFAVFRGAIEVSASSDTGVVVRVATREGVRVVGRNVGMPQALSAQALAAMWQGLEAGPPQHSDAPDEFLTMLGDQERGRALAQARRWLALRHHGRGKGAARSQGQGQAGGQGAGGANQEDRGPDGLRGPNDQDNGAANGIGNAGGNDGGNQGGGFGLGPQASGGQGFGGAGQHGGGIGGGPATPGFSNAIHAALNALVSHGRSNRNSNQGGGGGNNGGGRGGR